MSADTVAAATLVALALLLCGVTLWVVVPVRERIRQLERASARTACMINQLIDAQVAREGAADPADVGELR